MIKLFLSILFVTSIFSNDFYKFSIKDNGKIKNILVKDIGSNYITSKNYSFKDSSNILIKFENISPEFINSFETKYGLELKKVLIIGDYIYTHKSGDILQLINNISNEENIKTVKPLWTISVKTY